MRLKQKLALLCEHEWMEGRFSTEESFLRFVVSMQTRFHVRFPGTRLNGLGFIELVKDLRPIYLSLNYGRRSPDGANPQRREHVGTLVRALSI